MGLPQFSEVARLGRGGAHRLRDRELRARLQGAREAIAEAWRWNEEVQPSPLCRPLIRVPLIRTAVFVVTACAVIQGQSAPRQRIDPQKDSRRETT
jgi:hypothetical protein